MLLSGSDKTKLKVLGALLIVAGIVGYLRFGRPKAPDGDLDTAQGASVTVGTVMFSPADARKLIGEDNDTARDDPTLPDRDIFAPPSPPPLLTPEKNAAASIAAESLPPVAAKPEVETIFLKGLIRGRGKPRAFINDVVVGVGDKIEDFKLVEILNDRVVLVSSNQRVILKTGQAWSPTRQAYRREDTPAP